MEMCAKGGDEVGYSPRQFNSRSVYEVTVRTLSGLPFTSSPLMRLLLETAIARANRDQKVVICHYVWMSNHAHIMLVCNDQQGMSNFVGELKKKLTDSIKRLFGRDQLFLWERRSSIAKIATYEDLVERLQYFYLNPQRAGLIEDIDSYPGLTTWKAFQDSENHLEARSESLIPWIPATMLPRMPEKPDIHWSSRMVRELTKLAPSKEALTLYPNFCLKAFGCSAHDVESFKQHVKIGVRAEEQLLREKFRDKNRQVVGRLALVLQRSTLDGWKPKKRERRIFLICSDKALRLELLEQYKGFQKRCRKCYESYLSGYRDIEWPPGAFQPPLPRLYNWIAGAC
jgi:REP element-mobilizing transposase RayT